MRRIPCLPILLALALPSAHAATFTVTSTGDTGGSTCAATCTLRQAINAANAAAGADVIAFNIAGFGPHRIAPASALPVITDAVTINGWSEPGAATNTLDGASNAVIQIHLDGTSVPGSLAPGLAVCASDTVIVGLSITGFPGSGISIGRDNALTLCGATTGVSILGNFVGLLPDGRTAAGNGDHGVLVAASPATVGGAQLGINVISANGGNGVHLFASGAVVDGNLIGTDRDGEAARGNGQAGVLVGGAASDGNLVGGNTGNTVAYNSRGILIASGAQTTTLGNNRVFGNTIIGIDLAPGSSGDGVTPNDANDADTGTNGLQNFPQEITASRTPNGLSLGGRIDRTAAAGSLTYTIRVYANESCAGTLGQGQRFLGAISFTSTGPVNETFSNLELPVVEPLPVGTRLTLTATDPLGNTSEFSPCLNLDGSSPTFTVNQVTDTSDGACDAHCTLREAIIAANGNLDGNVIAFAILGTGPHQITLASSLPTILQPTLIDGYSQPGAVPNSASVGTNAVIQVAVSGTALGSNARGFRVCGDDVAIRGLSLVGFNGMALFAGVGDGDVSCTPDPAFLHVSGNFIGVTPQGSAGANRNGIWIQGATDSRIGGTALADRNLVSANDNGVTLNLASRTHILGNLIGTDRAGSNALGNDTGVYVLGTATDSIVGNDLQPNVIRFNGTGIDHSANTRVSYRGNDIGMNDGLGIDLCAIGPCPDGVTPNDFNDADTGPNGLQNFPSISTSSILGNVLTVSGTIDVDNGVDGIYRIDVFESTACDATAGNGEGEIHLGSAYARISGGAQGYQISMPNAAIGRIITLTATDPAGNSSEFSACRLPTDAGAIFANGFE